MSSTFTAYVVSLGMSGSSHPQMAMVELEHLVGDGVRTTTYPCHLDHAPALGARVKVTVEVQS